MKSISEIYDYLEEIPAEKWCAFTRNNGQGQHCVLGHLDIKYGICDRQLYDLGISNFSLAYVNNGTRDVEPGLNSKDGAAIKYRVLKYLKSLCTP